MNQDARLPIGGRRALTDVGFLSAEKKQAPAVREELTRLLRDLLNISTQRPT